MIKTLQEQIESLPTDSIVLKKVQKFLRQWAYDCAWWERYGISELGSHGEKCKSSQKLRRIHLFGFLFRPEWELKLLEFY